MKKIFFLIFILSSLHVFSQNIQQADSSKLIVDIYQFNDYYSLDTFGIDTIQRHIELFDSYNNSLLPIINLGQIGTPSLPIVFSQRTEFEDFMFLNPYNEYLLKPEKLFFYKTNNPYTDIKYIGSSKIYEQQNLDFLHTQSINNSNFGVKYEMITARNLATDNENSSINKLNVWYYQRIKKYSFYSSIFSNKIKRPENGGVSDTTSSSEYNTFLLQNSNNVMAYRGFYFNQSFDFSKKIKIRHIFNYSKIYRTFLESKPNKILGIPQLSDAKTYDSTGITSYDNTVNFFFKNKIANLGVSYTNKMQTMYFFRGFMYNLSGDFFADNFVTVSATDFKNSFFSANIIGKYHITSRKSGDFSISSNQRIIFDADSTQNIIVLTLKEDFITSSPGYFYENYNGNFDSWQNSFERIKNFNFTAILNFNKINLEIGGDYRVYDNYIYFDTLAMPQQISNKLYIRTAWLKKTFYLKPFVADINLFWQKTNNQEIVNIPEYIAAGSIYADFSAFKNAAHLNLGININYTSKFYLYNYRPTTGVFYNQNDFLTGNFPVANLFMTAKIKNAIIIVRFDNFSALKYDFEAAPTEALSEVHYGTVGRYYLSNFYLRFGVRWWFRN